jgi:hypothetical protein
MGVDRRRPLSLEWPARLNKGAFDEDVKKRRSSRTGVQVPFRQSQHHEFRHERASLDIIELVLM